MNKIIIFLISCSLLGIASSGSLYGRQTFRMYDQDLQKNHMISLRQMTQQELLRQKFVLDMLFNLKDRVENVEQFLSEYGVMEITAIRPEMCNRDIDEEMQYVMDLCNKCMQIRTGDNFSLSYTEELRQIMGLYRLFVTSRDFETLQKMTLLARKCFNGRIFAISFMTAIRDRQDTYILILPSMYEIMPEMYYTETDMEEMQKFQGETAVNPMRIENRPEAYYDRSYLWMPYREMRKQIMLQKMRGRMGYVSMPVNVQSGKHIVSLDNKMQHKDTLELFTEDLDLRAYVDKMIGHMMHLMGEDVKLKNEEEMRMRGYMPDMNLHSQGIGVSDAVSHINKMESINTMHDMDYQRRMEKDQMHMSFEKKLPTRNINDKRLLHVGSRHKYYSSNPEINRPQYMMSQKSPSVVDAADPRGLEALDGVNELHSTNDAQNDFRSINDFIKYIFRYYLQQHYNIEHSQNKMGSEYDAYEMRHRRSVDLENGEIYQSVKILLHNIRQLMTRIRMERLSMGESETMMKNIGIADVHGDLDRMRVIRLNKMGLDTRQARSLLEHFNEMEKMINRYIEFEMQKQIESGYEQLDIYKLILNIFMGRIKGVSIMQIFDGLQQDMMSQVNGQFSKQMYLKKRRIHEAVMTHFLSRMDRLIQQYEHKYEKQYELHDLMFPGVDISSVMVDKLMTFVDNRDDDLVNMLHCKDMKACLNEEKVMYARQPRLNHKSFEIRMQTFSDRAQDVIIRIFLASSEINDDCMVLDTRKVKLDQGQNTIKFKSSDVMWTMRDTTSYTQLYQYVMMALKNQYLPEMDMIRKQQCHFPHHLLLPRGRTNGFPMKLIVMISSMDDYQVFAGEDHMMCAMGIGNVRMDQPFYDFSLSRYIKNSNDMDLFTKMPNTYTQDILIYHE